MLVGTAGEGLILRLGRDGSARTLYDADQPEVVALAVRVRTAPATPRWSPPRPAWSISPRTRPPASAASAASAAAGGRQAEPRRNGKPPRAPAGRVTPVRAARSCPCRRPVWWRPSGASRRRPSTTCSGGTAASGWRPAWRASSTAGPTRQMLLEKDVDERQIVALLPGETGPAFATTNAAAFYRVTAETERSGTYTSAALDAGQARASAPSAGAARRRAAARCGSRSAAASAPSRTVPGPPGPRRARGEEITLGRCRAAGTCSGGPSCGRDGSAAPRLYGAELSYRQENLSPRIPTLAALEPGQILVPSNFNPSNQVYEPAHPNREGIFTTVGRTLGRGRRRPHQAAVEEGFPHAALDRRRIRTRTSWSTTSRSGPLKPTASGSRWRRSWRRPGTASTPRPCRTASTASACAPRTAWPTSPESALVAERVSDPVVIDHTPPALVKVERAGDRLRVTVRDTREPAARGGVQRRRGGVEAGASRPTG